jgi:steroid 5-alpha reductase family enzyme
MLWDIDLIFGIEVYNDLQIKCTFRSDPMIFGRIMAHGLWNLAKYLVVTTLFLYDLRYWLDFWYENV